MFFTLSVTNSVNMWLVLANVLFSFHFTSGYKILGLFPYAAKSHFIVFDALMVSLAERGHQVTTYNTYPKNVHLPNFKDVDIGECFPLPSVLSVDQMRYFNGASSLIKAFKDFTPKEEEIFGCKPLNELLNTNESYDVLLTETFFNDFFQMFGEKLNIPVITFHSHNPLPWMSEHTGLPQNPSYIQHPHESFPLTMNFVQRLWNTFYYMHSLIAYKVYSESVYENVAFRYFDHSIRPLSQVVKNASLLLLYTHFSLNGARPIVPNVVEVAGLNIKKPKALPKDIEKFINESSHGLVYFCMGSLLRGETFPAEKRDAFLYAFSKIPQRVLWKWEGEQLPGKLDNIMTAKWMPQRDILAHPNVKLFISHGGLLGTTEAVYEGVPVLGIPIFGDQKTNIRALESNGAGELLEYDSISKDVVLEKIQRLVNDYSYRRQAKELSIRYKDRPVSAMDTAVFWTEYVIRHRGAPHLKTAAVNMPWNQYLLLDVIAFVLLLFVTIYYVVKLCFRFICNLLCSKTSSVSKSKK